MLTAFLLAQKFWDDVPLTNLDFAQLMMLATKKSQLFYDYRLTWHDVNAMELAFLGAIDWQLHVPNATYLAFHFELNAVATIICSRPHEALRRINSERYVVELGAKELHVQRDTPRAARRKWTPGEQLGEKAKQGGRVAAPGAPLSAEQVCRCLTGGRAVLS